MWADSAEHRQRSGFVTPTAIGDVYADSVLFLDGQRRNGLSVLDVYGYRLRAGHFASLECEFGQSLMAVGTAA